jgi:shikimate kinase
VNAIFLTGFMATGKSAVGRALAARLGRPFRDTDVEIERAAGRSISEIFRESGEVAFRELEREALERVAVIEGVVVATGGGLPVDPANRRRMRSAGTIVRLDAPPEVILGRAGSAEDRPLLAGAADPAARVRELLEAREPAYADADHRVDVATGTPEEIAERIAARIEEGGDRR